MKTQRIKIKKGETVGIYLRQDRRTTKRYSTVAVGCDGPNVEQTETVNIGLRALLEIPGPVTVCIIRKKVVK